MHRSLSPKTIGKEPNNGVVTKDKLAWGPCEYARQGKGLPYPLSMESSRQGKAFPVSNCFL